ncbi:hypothetical protein GOODEAATRI_014495, partial [Goodea atripinnis]
LNHRDNYLSTLDLDLDFLAPFSLGGLARTRHPLSLGDRPMEQELGREEVKALLWLVMNWFASQKRWGRKV